jgi:alkanesulfonate monooxygenase SsuD/methylene tetrahydromethanopterin reductase-like flavin-dependent oxidoreductase (luciferase family)
LSTKVIAAVHPGLWQPEFIRYPREIRTEEHAEFAGDFYRPHDFDLKPKPLEVPGRASGDLPGRQLAGRAGGGRAGVEHFGRNVLPVVRELEAEAERREAIPAEALT